MSNRKGLFLVQVTSNGEKLGAIEPAQFLASVHAPRDMFLQTAVETFNAHKEAIGEPERVKVVLRKSVKSVH